MTAKNSSFMWLTLVPRQVAGNLDVAAQAAALEARHFTAAVEAAAVLAHMPALVLATTVQAGTAQFALGQATGPVLLGEDQLVMMAEHLILAIAEDQRGAGVPVGDQALLIKQDDGEIMGTLGDQAHALLALAQAFLGGAALADVDEGQHGAVDVALAGPIRQQAGQVPVLVVADHFALDGGLALDHRPGVVGQARIVEAMAC
ncbi:hypothetical protein WR25_21726 [Diploscapter pachys]|uniref:Uncharacterized protein n=1 Tax=Diploscapter pachys TaxID=2018661 RepID=A0A2A2M4W0_9BILA|nr:hypothetical protein WR25_21726 [Diploscapter pachys]